MAESGSDWTVSGSDPTRSGSPVGGDGSMFPIKRYPRLGRVSMNVGDSAESPKASRRRLMALFSPRSKSTNVSAGQSRFWISSRVITCPGAASRMARIENG